MKRIITLFFTLAVISFTFAQSDANIKVKRSAKEAPLKLENTEVAIQPRSVDCIWESDFSDSSDWVLDHDASDCSLDWEIGQNLESASWLDNVLVNLPLNTVLLLVIMIWAYTGFAAVVFSAGIKSIPTDIMEAGQIDGASELKIFVSIVVPYIKSTIIVVGTYMVITVLKAFDIVYVTTRGDLETNLLAVKMLDEFSKYRNIGRSSTVAVLIFICVIPIIIGNTYREKENSSI